MSGSKLETGGKQCCDVIKPENKLIFIFHRVSKTNIKMNSSLILTIRKYPEAFVKSTRGGLVLGGSDTPDYGKRRARCTIRFGMKKSAKRILRQGRVHWTTLLSETNSVRNDLSHVKGYLCADRQRRYAN